MSQIEIDYSAPDANRARRSDPTTSQSAAKRAEKFANGHAGRILAALRLHGAMTAHELGITGLTVVQCDRRLPELLKMGLAQVVTLDDGHEMVRGGCRVWMAVR